MSANPAPKILVRDFRGFPELKNDGETAVETVLFLEAAKEVVGAIESFGRLFSPITQDMRNNIEKITSVFDQNPQNFKKLEILLIEEKAQKSMYAANALLWLKRGLELISAFFYNIVHDKEAKNELKDALRDAYDQTLKPYHNWLVQSTFAVVYRFVPTREQLFGTADMHNENMTLLQLFQQRMHLHLEAINCLIATHDLDDTTKV